MLWLIKINYDHDRSCYRIIESRYQRIFEINRDLGKRPSLRQKAKPYSSDSQLKKWSASTSWWGASSVGFSVSSQMEIPHPLNAWIIGAIHALIPDSWFTHFVWCCNKRTRLKQNLFGSQISSKVKQPWVCTNFFRCRLLIDLSSYFDVVKKKPNQRQNYLQSPRIVCPW